MPTRFRSANLGKGGRKWGTMGARRRKAEQSAAALLDEVRAVLDAQGRELARLGSLIQTLAAEWRRGFSAEQLVMLVPRFQRNLLPNDSAALQKHLILAWRALSTRPIGYADLLDSGFRVFSQNDEDGVLLRLFSHVGRTNQCVVEIGSNCAASDIDIPENLSANLIVNHGWHGAIFEADPAECARVRHFFARDLATKHFHVTTDSGHGYFSPLVIASEITPENVDRVLQDSVREPEPDLMVIDIDGGDYAVIDALHALRPRVLVVEFERRFRDRHCVVQFDRSHFSQRWPQSGAASLAAWAKLLAGRGYALCAVGTCGFNAFFIRVDVAHGKVQPLSVTAAFDRHPILAQAREDFWLLPDETWRPV